MRGTRRALLIAACLAAPLACARSAPPPNHPAVSARPGDAGLPAPPPAAKKGVIVPADMGLGPGTPGRGPATPSPTPTMGAPGIN